MVTTLEKAGEQQLENAGPPPQFAMTQMITGAVWVTKSIYVAAELGIADLVANGPKDIETLAAETGTHADSLYRVLRALASLGIFAQDAEGKFGLTPLAATLRSDSPDSMRAMAQMWGVPWHWDLWDSFLDSIRTAKPAIEHATGLPLFQWFGQHPDYTELFNRAMSAFSGPEAHAVVSAYDFSGLGTLVDVGGGQGLLLATILRAYPSLRGILFDLPNVAAEGRKLLGDLGVQDRCTIETGDFFQSVPAGADAYILKNILHDFQDEQAATILRNIRRAMKPDALVLVVQEPLPTGNAPSVGKLLDIQMLLIGGRERTTADYTALFNAVGLKLNRIVPTPSPLSVIEGVPL
jgi:hypothetical protein